jgi:hypothetical protein
MPRRHPARSRPFFCTRQWGRFLHSAFLCPTYFFCFSGLVHAESLPYLLPLPPDIVPIATFGEVSPGVFHPGVDLPTGGETYEIPAAADGEICEVEINGGGYGKAVHLRAMDGREIVYAHLSHFVPSIEESCRVLQAASGSYDMAWIPAQGSLPVRRGDWIGTTGETEDGRRILHLEVRVGGTPRNPLRSGFAWPDRVPPRIHSIRFLPLDPGARIDGRLDGEVIDTERIHESAVATARTVLWGPIGVECEASDDVGQVKRAPYLVRLFLDDSMHFEADVGARVPMTGWIPERPEPADLLRGPVQRLYQTSDRDRGRILCGTAVRPGIHRLRIIARDAAGNLDSIATTIVVRPNPRVEEWMVRPLGGGDWDVGVRIGPETLTDVDMIRLTIDLTTDGRRFPIRTPIGHIGSGWFMGSVSSFDPRGRIGLRIRAETRDGITTSGPVVSLDPTGTCAGAAIDSPAVRTYPRWIELRARAGCIPSSAPKASLRLRGLAVPGELLETPLDGGEGVWRFAFPAPRGVRPGIPPAFILDVDGESREWRLPGITLARPADDLLWSSPDGALTVEIPAGTFYAPVWLSWTSEKRGEERIGREEIPGHGPNDPDEVLIIRSGSHSLAPAEVEIDAAFRVAIRPDRLPATADEAKRLGIYGRVGAEPWRALGGLWTGSAVVTVVDRIEEWIVLEDQSEPWIYALDPGPGERRVGRVTALSAQVREQGSGVAAGSFEAYLDGKRIPAAWNPWSRKLEADTPEDLSPGGHRWEVRVHDSAGNAARKAATFTVESGR